MSKTKNKKGHHVFISPPELSGESSLAYYLKFLKANLNPKFVIGFFDYKIFKKYRPYMQDLFNRVVYYHVSDNMTGDLYYGYDRLITEDKEKYYSEMLSNNAFNREPGIYSHEIKPAEKMLLKQINEILIKHGTDYKIVISPLFDQIPFDVKRMELLKSIFDKRNIYDFSGKNRYTESIYNFYESGHYRPVVADSIMEKIYSIKSSGEAEY